MKIILEFTHEEAKQAEQSYRGPDYAMAVEDFRNHLRNVIKHGEYSEEAGVLLTNIQYEFHQIFQGLIDD